MRSLAVTRRSTVILVSAVAAALLVPGVANAGTLDQQQTANDGVGSALGPGGNGSGAQTFTAGITGGLDQVDLALARVGTPTAYLTVEIRDASAGIPGQAVLAERSLPPTDITNMTPQFISVQFNPAAPVIAGTQYAIVAYSGNPVNNWYLWYLKQSDVYPGGQVFNGATPPSATWTYSGPNQDYGFRTYVVPTPASMPPPTPATGPTGQRAAALAKCKHKHGKKRKRCKQRADLLPV